MEDFSEKRRFKRVELLFDKAMGYCKEISTGKTFIIFPKDISLGGIGFQYSPGVELERGMKVQVNLGLSLLPVKMNFEGEVAWIQPGTEESPRKKGGIRFTFIDEENKELLHSFFIESGFAPESLVNPE